MAYAISQSGSSRSFPDGDSFLQNASRAANADILVLCGATFVADSSKSAILIELGNESLAEHIGDDCNETNVLGFARYCNGDDKPSPLVELVRPAGASDTAVAAARDMFKMAGLEVVVSSDQIGRIINRLVLPKYNAALRFLDEGLATQQDMDLTCKLGLGYPDGPIERVVRGGLARHFDVTQALFETYGTPSYAPPRRAVVASRRKRGG
ncbi:3-hydroxyacyl-CoA dehydrogenase family protein [Tardiphaga sp. OK245]|jgi:3-hydroxybutyryl-CoA dehydrogenase|uniref:3-hydroxyacyl-CoA dehydrogenase family protein n=1 Tax=Tardiphaga sp. OK245 TaxID=1855306 RepID=UPI0008A78E66|nr:3-hydroxyacyl-CoA dehydrogenase family protein [Tardiphaga sp. OK245]SEH88699.1 3-hydroxybutyryl-CoA dehydrogenase [Tardiphaga sp. OK245]